MFCHLSLEKAIVYHTHLYGFTINAVSRFFDNHSINSRYDTRLVERCIASKTRQAVTADGLAGTFMPEHSKLDITFHNIEIPCYHWLWFLYRHKHLQPRNKNWFKNWWCKQESQHVRWFPDHKWREDSSHFMVVRYVSHCTSNLCHHRTFKVEKVSLVKFSNF